jgi:transposase-like protein
MPKKLPTRFTNECAARKHLENIQWPDGPICPHCGTINRASRIEGGRLGLWFCNSCREQFTVTVGTIFERSHVPLNTWLYASHLLCSSKKGISSHQLSRMLGVSYKTAWFMAHRIRTAMGPAGTPTPMGGEGQIVEADETFTGTKKGVQSKGGHGHKHAVMALVERGGKVRSFHVKAVNGRTAQDVLLENTDLRSKLMTDEARYYEQVGETFAGHEAVNHSANEYVRGTASTNTVEGVFSIFKRGMVGTYQHCGEQHLQRYLHEFDFRYSHRMKLGFTDDMRADKMLSQIQGKRLTYRRIIGSSLRGSPSVP